jgi:hypothetical protein
LFKLPYAALPLVAGLLAFTPLSARADAGDDVVSFFGRMSSAVKHQVVGLPDQLGIADLIGSNSAAPKAVPVPMPVTTNVMVAPPMDFEPELPQAAVPALARAALPEPSVERPLHRLFCAEYARVRAGFPVFGDAKYWWEKAKNLYSRVSSPVGEAVMVFSTSKRLKSGHVAVVTDIVSPREIRVDQANWMNRGEIDHSTPVLDVSTANDWSEVRVWNVRSHQFGAHIYAISGFIVKGPLRQARD